MGEQTCAECDTWLNVPNDYSGLVYCKKHFTDEVKR